MFMNATELMRIENVTGVIRPMRIRKRNRNHDNNFKSVTVVVRIIPRA